MSALGLAVALTFAPRVAFAEPLPLARTVSLGHPPRAVAIRVEQTDEGPRVSAALGAQRASEPLPIPMIDDASIEEVEVAPDHRVLVVRASGGGAQAAAVVAIVGSAPRVLWTGRTDLHGDPGERSAAVISLEDRTSDGRPDVLVGVRSEGAALCGEEQTILTARAYDPSSATMRPVALPRVPSDAGVVTVTATRDSPGPTGAPLLATLAPTGASSTAGHGEELSGNGPPRALTDRDTATYWAEGRGGPGRGEFVALRWTAGGFPLRAIAITAGATGDAGRQLGRLQRFWLVGDGGARIRVQMPDDAGLHPGERYWIVPPEPLAWRCLAVVLDEAYAPARMRDAAVHTAIAEIEAYTELDFGEGIDQLVSILVESGRNGDEATRLLSGLGEPAVEAIAAAWGRLDEQGRRRGVRVYASGARHGVESAVDALAQAARDDADPVRTSALEALGTLGPRAGEYLAALVAEPGARGEEAVGPLLRHEPSIVLSGLLPALVAEGGSERPILREGLARALSRTDPVAHERFAAWASEPAPVPALASALLGLSSVGPTRPLVAPLLPAAIERAEGFEDRWRLIGAARQLRADPPVDAWLGTIATGAEEWMLRAAAVQALGRREADNRVEIGLDRLGDDYPRVRVEAIRVLDSASVGDAELARLARRDSWPMVREAAVDALWDREVGEPVVRAAIRDRSPRVRRAALRGATRAGDEQAWPLVRARLMDGEEWPQVTLAALQYIRDLCVQDASEPVLEVIGRGLRPDAWAPDVDVAAVAVDLALVLGGQLAEEATRRVSRPDTPPSIRAVMERRQHSPATCEPAH